MPCAQCALGFDHIVRHGPEWPTALRTDASRRSSLTSAAYSWQARLSRNTSPRTGASLGMAGQPARAIGARHHLAAPEHLEDRPHVAGGDLEGHPTATAASIQAEHQAGIVRRAAMIVRPQAKGPVIAAHRRQPPLAPGKAGMPDQGTVGKDPEIIAAVPIGQEIVHRRRAPGRGLLRLSQTGAIAGGGYCQSHEDPLISRFIPIRGMGDILRRAVRKSIAR